MLTGRVLVVSTPDASKEASLAPLSLITLPKGDGSIRITGKNVFATPVSGTGSMNATIFPQDRQRAISK